MIRPEVGELVTRDGSDVHRIIYVNESGDLIEVECIEAPATGWCKVGDREDNLPRRYTRVAVVVDDDPPRLGAGS